MRDDFARQATLEGNDPEVTAILEEVCAATRMGFAAVARVTETRWIACQVLDKIEFGLDAGEELDIKTTICDDIRACGRAVVIDDAAADPEWRRHPTPIIYGFKSYASFPIVLEDGSFYGTLCAIDPEPRSVSAPEVVDVLQSCAKRAAAILWRRRGAG